MLKIERRLSFNIRWENKVQSYHSECTAICGLDERKQPRLISVVCQEGNIIPLLGVKKALEDTKSILEKSDVPNQTA